MFEILKSGSKGFQLRLRNYLSFFFLFIEHCRRTIDLFPLLRWSTVLCHKHLFAVLFHLGYNHRYGFNWWYCIRFAMVSNEPYWARHSRNDHSSLSKTMWAKRTGRYCMFLGNLWTGNTIHYFEFDGLFNGGDIIVSFCLYSWPVVQSHIIWYFVSWMPSRCITNGTIPDLTL